MRFTPQHNRDGYLNEILYSRVTTTASGKSSYTYLKHFGNRVFKKL